MSVLVIGATDFIGPRLIRRLVARGESVIGMDVNRARRRSAAPRSARRSSAGTSPGSTT
jgi:nucleoside-diphosphate-sugar epimerase